MGLIKVSIALIYTITFLFKTHLCLTEDEKKAVLTMHNDARAEVKVGPISWDNKIEKYAQDFADKLKSKCDLGSSDGPYGENTAGGYGADTAEEAVGGWVSEKDNYNYSSNLCVKGKEFRHYTQVVWRNSTRIGCASVTCGAGWPIFVCEYDPPGNIQSQRPY